METVVYAVLGAFIGTMLGTMLGNLLSHRSFVTRAEAIEMARAIDSLRRQVAALRH